jgi:hypothetical protein
MCSSFSNIPKVRGWKPKRSRVGCQRYWTLYTMPTLGATIGPHQWESFHLNRSSCLVCNGKNVVHYTSIEVDLSRTDFFLIISNILQKEMNFPYQEELLMLPRSNN